MVSFCKIFAILLIFRGEATNAFSFYCPTAVSGATEKMGLLGNSFTSIGREKNGRQCKQRVLVLSAVNKGMNNKNQPDADRLYDFIKIEDADKMLHQERLRNEREIRQMRIELKRQHQELLEFDEEPHNIQLANDDDEDVIDLNGENNEVFEMNGSSDDDSPFSPPFPDDIDDEQYKQNRRRSHNNAECRTLEIALQQIDEDNQDLTNEVEDQRNRYQSEIEETQRLIHDTRDRFDCVQHELKVEASYFERAKVELEDVLDREMSRARELEQQLLLARREQEILEQAADEAQRQQQELEEEELELRRQQEQMHLEREEEERKQQQIQLEQEEHERQRRQEQMQLDRERQQQQQVQQQQDEQYRHEELLRNHQELAELEKHQKQFNDVYFSIYNNNNNNNNNNNANNSVNDNVAQNQNQVQQDDSVVNGGQEHHQYENSGDWVASTYSTQSTEFVQNNVGQHQQYRQWEWQQSQQTYSAAVTPEKNDPQQPGRASKRETRINSRSHGMYMNFNDMLV